jgi:hypothetical protein
VSGQPAPDAGGELPAPKPADQSPLVLLRRMISPHFWFSVRMKAPNS